MREINRDRVESFCKLSWREIVVNVVVQPSASWDPIPTMLCQNHTRVVKGFMGQTTSFNNQFIKSR